MPRPPARPRPSPCRSAPVPTTSASARDCWRGRAPRSRRSCGGRGSRSSPRSGWRRSHLATLEAGLAAAGIAAAVLALPPGEGTKGWSALERTVEWLIAERVARDDLVVAFGGGVIGDLAGFAAAVLRRGVGFVQIPTTLLAQVDSSVGGKTGINSPQGKNLVGAFHQPRLVLADTGLLDTLPERDFLAGYAEVVKYGLLGDAGFFAWLEANGPALRAGDPAARVHAVRRSCEMKAGIVARDETEQGERALLNLGHTFGHALEAATGYSDRLLHGEGVAIGCQLAFDLSARLGPLPAGGAEPGGGAPRGDGDEARPRRHRRRAARRRRARRADGAGQEGPRRAPRLHPRPRHRRRLRWRGTSISPGSATCSPRPSPAGREAPWPRDDATSRRASCCGVVRWQVALGDEVVGGLDRGDAGQRQLLHQPVLQGAEGALGAPARLRGVGRDVLDAELGQRPPHLGRLLPRDLPPAVGVWK